MCSDICSFSVSMHLKRKLNGRLSAAVSINIAASNLFRHQNVLLSIGATLGHTTNSLRAGELSSVHLAESVNQTSSGSSD